jgi:glycosyltransferase involved in cell wall biosynthesis
MSTYNGEAYVEKQLRSILHQTKQPDEVMIYDDGSTDSTVAVIRSFIINNGLESKWKIMAGTENRGYPLSFYYAMGLCTGDIVFLSDQDDIWNKHKIEKMVQLFEQHPFSNLISCKFGLINNDGEPIKAFMNPGKSHESGKCRSIKLKDVFGKYQCPGMVLAYRREWVQRLFQQVGEKPAEIGRAIPHDFILAAWAAESKTFLQLDETLAYHRRHLHNTAKEEHRIGKLLNRERKIWEIQTYNTMLDAMIEGKVLRTCAGRQALRRKREAMQARLEILKCGKLSKLIVGIWKFRNEVRMKTVICDTIIVCKMKKKLA